MSEYNQLKLAWACRRGMLELDFMIMPFYQNCFAQLSEAQKATFVELLDYSDPELFRWLMNQQTAPTPALDEMVKLIQAHLSKN
ncbi:FAD assembly factor SdhE [Testudinibacter sp. P80/BLE/0925]|uniref:FAD assembly factor SdhE n=1 Tax=Testudinibacter sp. TW-1 TaxID=3417757 RepID=UPI003D35EA67